MKFHEIPPNTPDNEFVFIECDITGKTKKTRYGKAKENVKRNNGKYITNWGLAKLNNPMHKKEIKEKVKKTTLEKYGTTCVMNTAENIKSRNEKMFGTEEAKNKVVEKRKKSNLEKYGVEFAQQLDKTKEKVRKTNMERYGVDVPLRNEDIKKKMRDTCQERYGVDNPCQIPEVRVKMAQKTLEKFGVEYYNQLPDMKDYLRENCREWLKESWENPWAKGIKRPEEWNRKQSETVMNLIDGGKWSVGAKYSIKGRYKSKKCCRQNPMFRSSYELKTHWHLDNDPQVEWYDYEPFKVAYYDADGKRRYYAIDFVVKYKNKDRLVAIEVKNDYDMKRFKECGKEEAFINECSCIMDFEIWSNDQIKNLNLDLETLLDSPLVLPLEE